MGLLTLQNISCKKVLKQTHENIKKKPTVGFHILMNRFVDTVLLYQQIPFENEVFYEF